MILEIIQMWVLVVRWPVVVAVTLSIQVDTNHLIESRLVLWRFPVKEFCSRKSFAGKVLPSESGNIIVEGSAPFELAVSITKLNP